MRKIFLFALVLFLLLTVCGCESLDGDWLGYNSNSFSAGLEYEFNSEKFTVSAVYGTPPEGEALRDMELTFSEPDELTGVRLIRKSGTYSIIYDGLTAGISSQNSFFEIPELVSLDFLQPTDLRSARIRDGSAELVFSSSDGNISVTMIKRENIWTPDEISTERGRVKILWMNFDAE